jgi:hypothetical protein
MDSAQHNKVELSLCLIDASPRYEDMWGKGGIAPPTFLISALDGGEWSASHPDRFTLGEWIGGWVNPRTGLDAVG